MIVRKVIEETQAKMFCGWNVTVLNEAIKVREEEAEQYHDDRLNDVNQHTCRNPLGAFSEPTDYWHTNLWLSSSEIV